MSSPAGTPTRRLTRSQAKTLDSTDSPLPSPSAQPAPSSSLRRQLAAQATTSDSDDGRAPVVARRHSPDVIVLDDSSADEHEEEDGTAEDDNVVFVEQPRAADEEEAVVAPVPEQAEEEGDEDESSGGEDASSSSEDEDDDASTSTSSGCSSDDDDDAPPALDDAALEALLSAAYRAADAGASAKAQASAADEVVLQLDQQKDQPLPTLSVPDMPAAYFSFQKDGRVSRGPPAGASNAVASSSKLAPTAAAALDTVALPAPLSKKAQKAARKANTPLGWAELPPIPDDRRKDMAKEYHALRLRNALDPKRHYKGQGSSKAVPEVFAIGKLHEPSKTLQSSTLATAASSRPGSVISDILADRQTKSYAKRKFGDLQAQRERNGRKKTTKKPRH